MRQVSSKALCDFAAIYDDDVELVSVARPQADISETVLKRVISSRQVPQLRWLQAANDPGATANALPASISADARGVLLDQIAHASEMLTELLGCEQVGIRLETLTAPMCPRFHVDHVPCRLLITLSGAGTEWIRYSDVDWSVFADLETIVPPLQPHKEIQYLPTGNWSLLKGGAWKSGFKGVVHRSPHGNGERLLLSLDPIMQSG